MSTQIKWVAANNNEVHDCLTEYDESGARIGSTASRICKVEYPFNDTEGKASIAHLFAAAPELLAACKGLMESSLKIAEELDIDASASIYAWIIDAQDAVIKAEKI